MITSAPISGANSSGWAITTHNEILMTFLRAEVLFTF